MKDIYTSLPMIYGTGCIQIKPPSVFLHGPPWHPPLLVAHSSTSVGIKG